MEISNVLAGKFNLKPIYAQNLINLIDEGCTIPFIARYRKEMHGSCDDQTIREFADSLSYLRNLNDRKAEVVKLLTEQGNLTPELSKEIDDAVTLTEIEDIYRPFRPKRKTRASVAIAAGLQPLADEILKQTDNLDLSEIAKSFINEEKGIADTQSALAGASDIIAEVVADDPTARKALRVLYWPRASIDTEWKEDKDDRKVYENYTSFHQIIKNIPPHRVLAFNRGEKEGALKVGLNLDKNGLTRVFNSLFKQFVHGESEAYLPEFDEQSKLKLPKSIDYTTLSAPAFVAQAVVDGYTRLLAPSLEREFRTELTDKANEQSIKMFEVNLEPLLMQPPLKGKTIMAVDPAYRTGCKIAVINSSGDVLDTGVVYPTPPQNKEAESIEKLSAMIVKNNVDTIAIGNGTASKEAEIFVTKLIKSLEPRKIQYAMVNESGASVYSASKLGAKEFPQYDVSIRSAVSIARRLQDPLAELIKIDPKSLGVGQYQHDMPQKRLSEVLDGVVEHSVNTVGVDLNTASVPLLTHVSGLNSGIATEIEKYRNAHNGFKSREELLEVNKLGAKAYEQCAGFLRIPNGTNILDNTAVHPESYPAVKKLLDHFGLSLNDVSNGSLGLLGKKVEEEGVEKVASSCGIGAPTLLDIITELSKPGRDVRDSLPQPVLRSELLGLENLEVGMDLDGVVRNVIDFGVFVDVGVHTDGMVHISEISDDYIKHPSDVLTVGDRVRVRVIGVDLAKQRLSLSIKKADKPV
ncbi:MAG: RNA-binding transcriptional accessory protein [Clostridia bacterium]|nr:RNA-binding transcriptional accessory protein [Clostridia bacterium]